mmetsp:Transcript_79425/g.236644  ORF Transcript_79425/g.236644 Transcript_79425/m.236644 type:complete len:235 (+) Transcript_79425:566-1270(+)
MPLAEPEVVHLSLDPQPPECNRERAGARKDLQEARAPSRRPGRGRADQGQYCIRQGQLPAVPVRVLRYEDGAVGASRAALRGDGREDVLRPPADDGGIEPCVVGLPAVGLRRQEADPLPDEHVTVPEQLVLAVHELDEPCAGQLLQVEASRPARIIWLGPERLHYVAAVDPVEPNDAQTMRTPLGAGVPWECDVHDAADEALVQHCGRPARPPGQVAEVHAHRVIATVRADALA